MAKETFLIGEENQEDLLKIQADFERAWSRYVNLTIGSLIVAASICFLSWIFAMPEFDPRLVFGICLLISLAIIYFKGISCPRCRHYGLKCFGYIALESQPRSTVRLKAPDGTVARKPLKGRKSIDAESGRVIPLLEKATFNALARRFNNQVETFAQRKYGASRSDYLLFDGLTKGRYTKLLSEAYKGLPFTYKSPHCARHTFATNFAGQTGADAGLCQLVLGHNDRKTTLGYVHLFEQINRRARTREQLYTKIDLVE